jgi:hypothetical protein
LQLHQPSGELSTSTANFFPLLKYIFLSPIFLRRSRCVLVTRENRSLHFSCFRRVSKADRENTVHRTVKSLINA